MTETNLNPMLKTENKNEITRFIILKVLLTLSFIYPIYLYIDLNLNDRYQIELAQPIIFILLIISIILMRWAWCNKKIPTLIIVILSILMILISGEVPNRFFGGIQPMGNKILYFIPFFLSFILTFKVFKASKLNV